MPASQKLLDMRLETLGDYVNRVRSIASDASCRGETLSALEQQLAPGSEVFGFLDQGKELADSLKALVKSPNGLREKLLDLHKHRSEFERMKFPEDELTNRLIGLPHLIDQVQDSLYALQEILRRARETSVRIDGYNLKLDQSLEDHCSAIDNDVADLRDKIQHGGISERDSWLAYENLVSTKCEVVFAEYVDFLGGLTLRDASLDGQVCRIADNLIRELVAPTRGETTPAEMIALPARRDTVHLALKRLLRLGFPEWSLWELPFVARELGLFIALDPGESGRRSRSVLAEGIPDHRSEFATEIYADAFATYTMGPAYACASALLRFQPHHDASTTTLPSDVERAALVFGVLHRLDPTSTNPLAPVVEHVRQLWANALAGVDHPARLHDTAFGDFTDDFCEAMRTDLRGDFLSVYGASKSLDGLRAMLADDSGDLGSASEYKVCEVINAAWAARLTNLGDSNLAQSITDRVAKLWGTPKPRGTVPGHNRVPVRPPQGGRDVLA
ncbi:hypothetical protein ACFVHB_04315 [Kitasatospora sp. NPDC127111]|uniref:hypothetical protein n=1 Tax=Kitasatospora sp. NPDC127111 TaxID=3345363 RepID=UPI003629ADEF